MTLGSRNTLLLAVLFLSGGAMWAQTSSPHDLVASSELDRRQVYIASLTQDLRTSAQASYLSAEVPLHWRLEQSFEEGSTPCIGETWLHETLISAAPNAHRLWDRHVRRSFSYSQVKRIFVEAGATPNIYTVPTKFISGSADAYTVKILTEGNDIEIEYHGFDGGRVIAKEAPLFFSTYYHDMYVIARSKAINVAAHLHALSKECGAENVQVDDLTK